MKLLVLALEVTFAQGVTVVLEVMAAISSGSPSQMRFVAVLLGEPESAAGPDWPIHQRQAAARTRRPEVAAVY